MLLNYCQTLMVATKTRKAECCGKSCPGCCNKIMIITLRQLQKFDAIACEYSFTSPARKRAISIVLGNSLLCCWLNGFRSLFFILLLLHNSSSFRNHYKNSHDPKLYWMHYAICTHYKKNICLD